VRRSPRLPLDALAPYLLQPPDPPTFLDWAAVFGNANPVEVEVGCGKGLFLVTRALTHAGANYLGIEIERKYQLFTATRIAKRALSNVRLVKADARTFLHDCVPPGSLHAMHVYFPDPWWKRRHQKRRVFAPSFAAECARVLRNGGVLRVATDVEEYFRLINELLKEQPDLLQRPWTEPANHAADAAFTNFERKARLQGSVVFRAVYERR
jgi:tRNA (guanine-N7-)-methyltransferase